MGMDTKRDVGIVCVAVIAVFACVAPLRAAEPAPPPTPAQDLEKARAVVADLQRIPNPEGIDELAKVRLNGAEQWMSIRGRDRANPVVVFVHGGPATPTIPSLWQFQRPLEDFFTMVNFDQRGAGKSYREDHSDAMAATLRIDTYADDVIAVAEHARARLGVDKVILMAHSWGTIPAMRAVLARPDLFHAYAGVGQVINVRDNERISIEFGLAQAKAHGNTAAVREIEAILPYPGDQPITRERIVVARKWPQHYGGMAAHRDETNLWFYGAARLSPDYSAEDRAALNAGSLFTLGRLLDEFVAVDFKPVTRFPVPVVMLHGRDDYTTPTQPVVDWMARLDAPAKREVWFEHSAHMAPWEEPGKFVVAMVDVVRPFATGDAAR